jgi:hypothetical protein
VSTESTRLAAGLAVGVGLLACCNEPHPRVAGSPGRARPAAAATFVAAHGYNTCAVRGGKVYCWGAGGFDGAWKTTPTPARVGTFEHATRVSVGDGSACVVDDGAVWCWGVNTFGEVGDGTTSTRRDPVRVRGLPPAGEVAATCSGACAVAHGALWCWGSLDGPSPKLVSTPAPVTAIASTCASVCVVSGGDVLCRGTPSTYRTPSGEIEDMSGGLGSSLAPLHDAPRGVTSVGGGAELEVVAGGTLEVWQPLATRLDACESMPAGSVPCAPTLRDVTSASSSAKETCAIARGVVRCFKDDHVAPRTIRLPAPATEVTSGNDHHCALAGGEVYCWGSRGYPALGDGTPLCVPSSCWDSSKPGVDGGSCEPGPGCRREVAEPVRWPD